MTSVIQVGRARIKRIQSLAVEQENKWVAGVNYSFDNVDQSPKRTIYLIQKTSLIDTTWSTINKVKNGH